MNAELKPFDAFGSVQIIQSKSEAHRMLICSALADAPTELIISELSEDISATADCLNELGAKITKTETGLSVIPIKKRDTVPTLDCRESGSTLRFLLPVACALYEKVCFTGKGRLPERPLTDLQRVLNGGGVSFSSEKLPFTTTGIFKGGDCNIAGNVSSQYVTGLLFALSVTGGKVKLTTKLESKSYVDITAKVMKDFGNAPSEDLTVKKKVFTSPKRIAVGGDWSNAAFFMIMGVLSGEVTVKGLDPDSAQGDKRIVSLLREMGADITVTKSSVICKKSDLHAITADVSDVPDAVPVLSVAAATANGRTVFTNAARLRLKESDRIKTTSEMLSALGIRTEETEDTLSVCGGALTGGTVNGYNDHRIVMAAATAAAAASGTVTVTDMNAVNKSYPSFFEALNLIRKEK